MWFPCPGQCPPLGLCCLGPHGSYRDEDLGRGWALLLDLDSGHRAGSRGVCWIFSLEGVVGCCSKSTQPGAAPAVYQAYDQLAS